LVADTGQCGWNSHRYKTDDKTKTAKMKVRRSEWKNVIDSFELSVGKVGKEGLHDACIVQRKRGEHERNLTMDFNHPWDLGKKDLSSPSDSFTLSLSCDECGKKGSFELSFYLKTHKHNPQAASFTLTPHGVSARIAPKLTLSGDFTEYSQGFELAKIPIYGYLIPEILDLGPEIVFAVGGQRGSCFWFCFYFLGDKHRPSGLC
jgi:hypothetical protein